MSEPLSLPAASARNNDGRALAAALVAVTLWASAFVGIRAAGEDLSAGPLTLLRLAIGSVGLGVLALALARRDPLPTRRDIPGLLGTWAYALARTSAGRMGSTTYLVPPLAVALGWAFLGETPPAFAFLGGVLCLLGVYLTRSSGWPRVSRRGPRKSSGSM